MAMTYTPIPLEFLEEMGELSDAEYGRLIRWAQKYHLTGEAAKLSGNERFYIKRVQNQIDRFTENYDAAVEQKRAAGRAGAGKRWGRGMADDSTAINEMADDSENGYTETYTETKTNNNTPSGCVYKRVRTREAYEEDDGFEQFWTVYPKRTGDIRAAYQEYLAALGSGVSAGALLDGATRLAESDTETRYLPSAEKWLKNRGWTQAVRAEPQKRSKKSGTTMEDTMAVLSKLRDEYREAGI